MFRSLVQTFPEASLGFLVACGDSEIGWADVMSSRHLFGRPGRRLVGSSFSSVIPLGIDGMNPVYCDTIKVVNHLSFSRAFIHEGAVHTPTIIGIAGGCPLSSYYFVGSQADNLVYLDPHHTHQTIPLLPPTQTSGRGIPNQASHAREGLCHPPAIIVRLRRLRPFSRAQTFASRRRNHKSVINHIQNS